MSRRDEILEQIRREVIIAVVREESEVAASELARTFADQGLSNIEITLTSPGALHVIQTMSELYSPIGIAIGAGSVRNAGEAAQAHEAGAQFLVSPHTKEEVIRYAAEHDLLCVAGAATPTEIVHAWELGASIIKVYPARHLGGPAFFRTVREPIRNIPMLAGGPVAIEEILDYLDAGAIAVNMGSSLAPHEAVAARDWSDIGRRIAEAKLVVDSRNDRP